jgi:hypothetical protein
MCRSRIARTISRLQTTIAWHFGLAGTVGVLALAVLIVTYLPNPTLRSIKEKALGNLVTIFFSAISGLSVKEIQNKRDKVLLLQFVVEEYEELDVAGNLRGSPEHAVVENHCVLLIEKILGGS